jgi:hypothetical protein
MIKKWSGREEIADCPTLLVELYMGKAGRLRLK